ncbi:hypothetical protein ACTFIW_003737 [Dictyostelium discoideum]
MKYIKEFDYELRHISGKKDGIADFLSRRTNQFSMVIRDEKEPKFMHYEINDICYLSEDFYFKEMFSIIKRYIKSCSTCQLNINRKEYGILQSLEIPYEVWRNKSIDFLSLPKTMYALNDFTV